MDVGANLSDAVDGPILLTILGIFLVPVAVVLAVFVAEIALLLLVVSLLAFGRSAYVGRWPIDVFEEKTLVHVEAVRGWGDSGRRMLEIADGIRRGDPPRPARRHRAGEPAD